VYELQVFAWWVDKVLPAACQDSRRFAQDKRMFIPVSKYAPTDKPSQPYVLTSDEAFALLYFEGMDGNLKRWWNEKQAHPDKSLKLCDFKTYKKNNPGQGDHPKAAPNVRYVDHATHGNKWTILNGGQQKNGSWKDKAIERFREIKVLAANGRQHTNCEALEEVATGVIREQLGVEVMTLEEWEELQKNKKHRKKEKKDGIETISDIEDGEDGNICEYGLAQLMADCGETAGV
jgi:hypothetical protein